MKKGKKKHWTQTRKGREIMRAQALRRHRDGSGFKGFMAGKKVKIDRTAKTVQLMDKEGDPAKPKSKMALAKETVTEFAKVGAHARLIEIEREAERIRIFLGLR